MCLFLGRALRESLFWASLLAAVLGGFLCAAAELQYLCHHWPVSSYCLLRTLAILPYGVTLLQCDVLLLSTLFPKKITMSCAGASDFSPSFEMTKFNPQH